MPTTINTRFGRIAACLCLTLTLLACSDEAPRNRAGEIVGEGTVDIFAMVTGDCFNDAANDSGDASAKLGSVTGVPCDAPHDNEIFASFRVMPDEYPGEEALVGMARQGCAERLESLASTTFEGAVLRTVPLYPTRRSWVQEQDRQVLCIVYRQDAQPISGSVRGAPIANP